MRKMTEEEKLAWLERDMASRYDFLCFMGKEISMFFLVLMFFSLEMPGWVMYSEMAVGCSFGLFAIVRNFMIAAGKVKAIKGRYLGLLFSIQGLCLTLFLVFFFAKGNVPLALIIALMVFHILAIIAVAALERKTKG